MSEYRGKPTLLSRFVRRYQNATIDKVNTPPPLHPKFPQFMKLVYWKSIQPYNMRIPEEFGTVMCSCFCIGINESLMPFQIVCVCVCVVFQKVNDIDCYK
jgi:hypothetical protein